MQKAPNFKRVARAVKASVASGVVFVHPLRDRSELSTVTAATVSGEKSAYECSHCHTTVVASKTASAPHCVVCSTKTTPIRATVTIDKPASMDHLIAVECKHCKTTSVMETNAVTASAHSIYCLACGGHNDYSKKMTASMPEAPMAAPAEKPLVKQEPQPQIADAEEDIDETAAKGDSEAPETIERPEAPATEEKETPVAASDEWPYSEEETAAADVEVKEDSDAPDAFKSEAAELDSDEMKDDHDIDIEDLDDFVPDLDEKANADEMPAEDIDADQVESHSTLDAPSTPSTQGSDSYIINLASTDEEDDSSTAAAEEPKMTESDQGDALADAMEMDDTPAGVSFEAKAGRIVAMKGHVTIASLTEEGAGKNADIMRTKGFHTALASLARDQGLRKTLVSAGFKLVRIPVLSKATVERRVREAVEASSLKQTRELATMSESLAIAAAGLSRGQWKGKENPLLAAFSAELKTAGVRNPERAVARVLAENVVPFTRTLVEVASELNKLSERGRKETAALFEMTTPTAIVSSKDGDDEESEYELEARLNTTAAIVRATVVPTTRSQRHAVSASNADDVAAKMLSGELPMMFSN